MWVFCHIQLFPHFISLSLTCSFALFFLPPLICLWLMFQIKRTDAAEVKVPAPAISHFPFDSHPPPKLLTRPLSIYLRGPSGLQLFS